MNNYIETIEQRLADSPYDIEVTHHEQTRLTDEPDYLSVRVRDTKENPKLSSIYRIYPVVLSGVKDWEIKLADNILRMFEIELIAKKGGA